MIRQPNSSMSSLQTRRGDNQPYRCDSPTASPTLPDQAIHQQDLSSAAKEMLANSQVAHRLGLIAAQSYRYSQTLLQADFSAAAASTAKSTYNVPEGHHNSDLSNTACNIGLGRRRDLTMRQDLRLWDGDKPLTLAQVFHVSAVCAVWFCAVAHVHQLGCSQARNTACHASSASSQRQ